MFIELKQNTFINAHDISLAVVTDTKFMVFLSNGKENIFDIDDLDKLEFETLLTFLRRKHEWKTKKG